VARRGLVALSGCGCTGGGGRVALESGIGMEVRRALANVGHRLHHTTGGFGGYQAIGYDAENDVYIGVSESRKDGQAAGY